MNIILKFKGLGYKNECQACVLIYDEFCNLIVRKMTYSGQIKIYLDKNKLYYLYAKSLNEKIRTSFYVDDCCYKFYFPRSIYKDNDYFTFLLTDSFYEGLKIEKGELFLRQR